MKNAGNLYAAFMVFVVTSNNGRIINKTTQIKLSRNNTFQDLTVFCQT